MEKVKIEIGNSLSKTINDVVSAPIFIKAEPTTFCLLANAISLAQSMGLSTINDPTRYGLSLVLGGGEVTLLEITNAYGVFANNGIYTKQQGILEVRDRDDSVLEKFASSPIL